MPACCIKIISQILPKISCPGNVPKGIKKRGPDREYSREYLSFGEKIVKIGPVDTEIICPKLKKKKLQMVKYIARSASLPSGLKNYSRPVHFLCTV